MKHKGRIVFFYMIVVLACVSFSFASAPHTLKVTFLDIGQGDAIFIETPNGRQILVDAGPSRAILAALGDVMPLSDKSIDIVLTTHPDADHIGGVPSILDTYEVGLYIDNGRSSPTATYGEIQSRLSTNTVATRTISRGEEIDLGDGVQILFLYPDRTTVCPDTNTCSLVARVSYGNTAFLLTGDTPTSVEEYLVRTNPELLKSDILKIAHHGSKNSLSLPFFTAVSPQEAVISAGRNNRYGHPHASILSALSSLSIPTVSTYDVGSITFLSDGQSVVRQ